MKRSPSPFATLPAGSGVSLKSRLALYWARGSARGIRVILYIGQAAFDEAEQGEQDEREPGGDDHHREIARTARDADRPGQPDMRRGGEVAHLAAFDDDQPRGDDAARRRHALDDAQGVERRVGDRESTRLNTSQQCANR